MENFTNAMHCEFIQVVCGLQPSSHRYQYASNSCDKVRVIMASRSVNKVILVGNLGRDAETKFTPSGAAVTRFAIATTRSWKDQQSSEWKEETNWSNVVLWRQENLANYLTKGKQVYVEGRLRTHSYDDKDGKKVYATEVVAEEVILLGGRGDSAPAFEAGAQAGARTGAPKGKGTGASMPAGEEDAFGGLGVTDDDVPF
jgi:single-strand DNA-binding protein